ncbi:SDR family oxidoreductase [Tardiphaga alba]|uniref:SDR family oxidoreductase n=1 Tax=Tardiphaga alba TaxID=340268 RepID=A0ABX8AC07_9BRAD|nr:SDR family oxidoreductase [Tardiphaga alba]QUS40777.1 SDR family oxidoreductase [Tardiphaga alba]
MKKIIVITGASSGFGLMSAKALAQAGHTVFAGMRETTGRNAGQVETVTKFAREQAVDIRPLELDVGHDESVGAAIAKIITDAGRLDVVIHNAGHMVYGPAECFTTEQLAAQYDVNVLSTQRVNRAVLPYMRERRDGLVLWVSSSSARGGTPPYLAPYFAAKAAMDSLAVSYAGELARWGIETTIVVPGSFTTGTNHFAHAGKPGDTARAEAYADGPTADIADIAVRNLAAASPPESDPEEVARAIVRVVGMPFGKRPFRVHIDPVSDGAEVVNAVADRIRAEFLRRVQLGDLLTPHTH